MDDKRNKKAKLNMLVGFAYNIVSIICGLIVPRLLIGNFGSEAYGTTVSIAQFLSYIVLIEGGIGGIARSALYKPIAENDDATIGHIMYEINAFFKVVGFIFFVYVLFIASTYRFVSNSNIFDWLYTFFLVLVISISTMAQYFVGLPYEIFLASNQKGYVSNFLSIVSTILNTILVVILIFLRMDLIWVKLISASVFVIKPIFLKMYYRKKYGYTIKKDNEKKYLTQKATGVGQHIAYFFHSNTDIFLLTIFSGGVDVAIYSVYYMVTSKIQGLIVSMISGDEAYFGSLIARKEKNELIKTFNFYEVIVSILTIVLFGTSMVLIYYFVGIYTKDIKDANYLVPYFGYLLIISAVIYCWRIPYNSIVIAAGHFKQTKIASYGEALLNIIISIILVINFGLVGVAIGTIISVMFKYLYYIIYLTKNILKKPIIEYIKRLVINSITLIFIFICENAFLENINIENYFGFMIVGLILVIINLIIGMLVNFIFYKKDFKNTIARLKS